MLLDRGADLDAHLADGYTPLHFAAWDGDAETVRLLLDRGADPDTRDGDGHPPDPGRLWGIWAFLPPLPLPL